MHGPNNPFTRVIALLYGGQRLDHPLPGRAGDIAFALRIAEGLDTSDYKGNDPVRYVADRLERYGWCESFAQFKEDFKARLR